MTQSEIEGRLNDALLTAREVSLKRKQYLDAGQRAEELGERLAGELGLVALREEYARAVAGLLVRQRETAGLLAGVEQREQRLVLEARYVLGMKWDDVAELLHYTPVHVFRLAKWGMQALCGPIPPHTSSSTARRLTARP